MSESGGGGGGACRACKKKLNCLVKSRGAMASRPLFVGGPVLSLDLKKTK